jgi:hypothetical protein
MPPQPAGGTAAALRACLTDPAAFASQCELAGERAREDVQRQALVKDGVPELVRASPAAAPCARVAVAAAHSMLSCASARASRWQVCVWLCAHRQNAAVQAAGCRVLRALGPEPYGVASPGRTKAAAAGGVQAVIAGMRAHAADAAVQQAGCAALWFLARTPAIATAAAPAALDAVVAALRVHATHAAVNEAGCGALRNLAMEERNKALFPGCGALEAIIAALRVHSAHAGVQEQAAGALVNVGASARNAVLAVAAGAVEALLAALCASSALPAVCLPACVALYNLTWCSPDAQRRARGAGAASVLRELLAVYAAGARAAHRLSDADSALLREAVRRVLNKIETPEPTREERGELG